MATGQVKWFNNAKGFGFIRPEAGGADVFVHYSQIAGDGFRTLNEGESVKFELKEGPHGHFAESVLRIAAALGASVDEEAPTAKHALDGHSLDGRSLDSHLGPEMADDAIQA